MRIRRGERHQFLAHRILRGSTAHLVVGTSAGGTVTLSKTKPAVRDNELIVHAVFIQKHSAHVLHNGVAERATT